MEVDIKLVYIHTCSILYSIPLPVYQEHPKVDADIENMVISIEKYCNSFFQLLHLYELPQILGSEK